MVFFSQSTPLTFFLFKNVFICAILKDCVSAKNKFFNNIKEIYKLRCILEKNEHVHKIYDFLGMKSFHKDSVNFIFFSLHLKKNIGGF